MDFEQADKLCTRIIDFSVEQGGPYPDMDKGYLQWVILSALGSSQFVIKIDRQGIRYFACWWWMNQEALDDFHATREIPRSIDCGNLLYVAEVISRGVKNDAREMIRRIRKSCELFTIKAYWHQPHRASRLCSWKELKA
jgi:hemolysin-activating ACP:hemolysin acyltransferase